MFTAGRDSGADTAREPVDFPACPARIPDLLLSFSHLTCPCLYLCHLCILTPHLRRCLWERADRSRAIPDWLAGNISTERKKKKSPLCQSDSRQLLLVANAKLFSCTIFVNLPFRVCDLTKPWKLLPPCWAGNLVRRPKGMIRPLSSTSCPPPHFLICTPQGPRLWDSDRDSILLHWGHVRTILQHQGKM